MGLGRKLVRRAMPRSARRAMHPVRTLRYAATPRSVKRASRIAYTITNPLGAAQNHMINSVINVGSKYSRESSRPTTSSEFNGAVLSGSGVRAEAGADSYERIAELMLVGRERFVSAAHPVIPEPTLPDPTPWYREEWQRRKHEVKFWQRTHIKELKSQAHSHAEICAEMAFTEAMQQHRIDQADADEWWKQLMIGEPNTLRASLEKGFSDNFAPVFVIEAEGSNAVLSIRMPRIEILPDKKMNITPTGRLSSKAWTKAELHETYAELLAAHLLATAREAWAVGPSLQKLRVLAMPELGKADDGFLFDVDVFRSTGNWDADYWGETVLESAPVGLNRVGKAREVRLWPIDQLRPDDPT